MPIASKRPFTPTSLAFTLGTSLFLLLLGALLALGASPLVKQVNFVSPVGRALRGTVGLFLVGMGVWQVNGRPLNFSWLNRLLAPLWEIAARLHLSEGTVRNHVSAIFAKLDVPDRTNAAIVAIQSGL